MANILPNWSQYLGMGNLDTDARDATFTTSAGWQQMLKWAQQYDPSASLGTGSLADGGMGTRLIFDNSKLPQNVTGGHGIENISRGTPGSGERLANPDAVAQDPVYGAVTNWRNLQEKGPSMVDILGPILVGAATMGGSLLGTAPGMLAAGADAAGSGALAAGGAGYSGAGSQFWSSLLQKAPGLLNSASNAFSNPTGPSAPQQTTGMSPEMLALLRALQQQQQGGG